jgi:5-methylcytosine-specific restriction endonuclease McrA
MDNDLVICRKAAITAGLDHYFTGKPCKHGHLSKRFTRNKTCVACDLARHVGNPVHAARCTAYYLNHREAMIADQKARDTANRTHVLKRKNAHRALHKKRINTKIAEWAKANPTKRRAKERSREARERGAEGTHTWADIEALKEKQAGRCAAPGCGSRLSYGFHVDHIMPILRNGTNWPSNLQLLCPAHNQSKGTQDPTEWLASLLEMSGDAAH